MNKKRNKLEIIKDILQVIRSRNGKIKPTHILYKSNLSHQMMEEYLRDLKEKDFIQEHKTKTGRTFSITEKGLNYLNQYSVIIEFTESFGLS
ncbi:MAG: winged helix-turn-helix domain-containing protein [Candidatus Pacearchaeota archaeon]